MKATITLDELKGLVRTKLIEAKTQRAAADKIGISYTTLWSLLRYAHRKPGPRLLKALGYQRVDMYTKVKP